MRGAILLGLALVLAACGSDRKPGDTRTQVKGTLAGIRALVSPPGPPPDPATVLSPQVIAALKGPVLLARVESLNLFGIVEPVRENRGVTTWRSSDDSSLSLEGPVLVSSRGLGADLLASDAGQTARLLRAGRPGTARREMRWLDGANQMVVAGFTCEIADKGPVTVDLLHGTAPARLWTETCEGPAARFENRYWISDKFPDGLKSSQWLHPELGAVVLERLN